MSPIPKLGMAIHNNNKPNADNPSGFDFLRGTMVTDAKSHSFSRNPTKLGLEPCEDCVSTMVSSVKDGSSRAGSSCVGPRNSGAVPPNPLSKEERGSANGLSSKVEAPGNAGNIEAADSETRGRRLTSRTPS